MPLISANVAGLLESESLDDLQEAIQQAIALEHATIPPYLFALYSIGASNLPAYIRLKRIFAALKAKQSALQEDFV